MRGIDGRAILAAVGLLALAHLALAQPVRDRVLDYVRVAPEDACTTVRIGFTFPVRYVRHFPFSAGNELRIQIEPVSIGPGERSALFEREAITPPGLGGGTPTVVTFEGDIAGGPFLTLMFAREVSFRVGQGADYRSIVVAVYPGETPAADTGSCADLPLSR